ncbi:proteasome regulatory particle base subunit rpn10 [Coemansia sp. RSA 1822]|nr:proteasome regulatory particle base subunit rpn10 [Coemansia sp. RSA 638]KAJ2119915.1 proteasome regulatory particle base subunit rpn10 [Coemansia sp. RSA 720]KAJ2483084.1 proteasome regulatory particle base subunit rpn10 [Coemansia sp. RSA 2131]KAJ2539771.1 proteasome regulatory particle base subunit rpn10 [Coemansia sp. RSA 1853]KAJ2560857.1 proteasome regulatory particle base subunit rpn10 [Coemansia sp. RSA 1822]
MVLEATVLIIDNSEWSRNGDYMPTRYDAQVDAVRYLFNVKTSDNPENTVGVIANGGSSPQVLVSLTSDQGVLLRGMHELSVRGTSHFDIGIQIAQLVLKHRANKHQKQRIITFTTSPIETDEKTLVRLGKKLKKNGVSIDVISFGEHVANEQKLAAFVEAANNNDMSHLVTVPPGAHVLSEQIRASAIVGGASSGGEGGDFEFGVDPDMDPELALALRMSMQEEEERQRRDAASRPEAASSGAGQGAEHADGDVMMEDVEDEEIREAIRMSLMDGQGESSTGNAKNDDLVASLIGSLPGVDSNDPALQNALGPDSKKDEDESKDKGKGK